MSLYLVLPALLSFCWDSEYELLIRLRMPYLLNNMPRCQCKSINWGKVELPP